MKRIFCTLFDSYFLSKGITLFESLKTHCPDFILYVFAFDTVTENYLKSLNERNLVVIPLKEFEDQELLNVKPKRSLAEYCWTSTPSTILYVLKTFNERECTYLDSDLCFFDNPEILFSELHENDSVIITDHRYTKVYDKSKLSGKYCVQFMYFKNDERGLKVLQWWRNACLDWCYNRVEDGKFGDQKYLDDWTERFEGIHVLSHLGGGVAPWNVQQYRIHGNDPILLEEKKTKKIFPLVFYHFHSVTLYKNEKIGYDNYFLGKTIKSTIYKFYAKKLIENDQKLLGKNLNMKEKRKMNIATVSRLKNMIFRTWNVYPYSEVVK